MATLKKGSTGPEVVKLQQRLTDLGFDPNGIDGKFGPGTEAAVKAFQQANGLVVDGIVGPNTRAALQLDTTAPAPAAEKVLWVNEIHSVNQFIQRAVGAKVTAVAVWTRNTQDMPAAIVAAHAANLKIYGWRWPSTNAGSAMAEADRAVAFLNQGMDGYFVDPEGHQDAGLDWDRANLDQLARDFCARVKQAAGTKPFGVTSHYQAKQTFPNLPWKAFFDYADVLLPQAYWRSTDGHIGTTPAQNYERSIQCWVQAGGDQAKIVPMAGELLQVNAAEINEHVAAAKNAGIGSLHFYTDEPGISSGVWDAIEQA